jgi:hypothetical protein
VIGRIAREVRSSTGKDGLDGLARARTKQEGFLPVRHAGAIVTGHTDKSSNFMPTQAGDMTCGHINQHTRGEQQYRPLYPAGAATAQ